MGNMELSWSIPNRDSLDFESTLSLPDKTGRSLDTAHILSMKNRELQKRPCKGLVHANVRFDFISSKTAQVPNDRSLILTQSRCTIEHNPLWPIRRRGRIPWRERSRKWPPSSRLLWVGIAWRVERGNRNYWVRVLFLKRNEVFHVST